MIINLEPEEQLIKWLKLHGRTGVIINSIDISKEILDLAIKLEGILYNKIKALESMVKE